MLPAAKQVLLIMGPVMGCLHNKICRCYPLTWIWSCVKMGFVHDICVVVRLLRQGRVFHPSGWTAQCRGGHLVPGRSGAVRTRGVVSGLSARGSSSGLSGRKAWDTQRYCAWVEISGMTPSLVRQNCKMCGNYEYCQSCRATRRSIVTFKQQAGIDSSDRRRFVIYFLWWRVFFLLCFWEHLKQDVICNS